MRAFAIEAAVPPDDHTELRLRIDVPLHRSLLGTPGGHDAACVRRIPEPTEGIPR
jgi:hypothetical protein